MNGNDGRRNHRWLFLLVGFLVGALAAGAAGVYYGSRMNTMDSGKSQSRIQSDDGHEKETDGGQGTIECRTEPAETVIPTYNVSGIVKDVMPSVVAITNKSVQEVQYMFRGTMEIENESSGSGFILAQNDTELLIATNYHVIEGASSLTVCFSAEAEDETSLLVRAAEKGSEPQYDLAVVAVKLDDIPAEIMEQIKPVRLGSSGEVLVGEPAVAIGNALGYGQSVTLGIISALDRTFQGDDAQNRYLQTDAAINFGNSGGALLNASGEVIGINSAKAAQYGVEGMGYAIPIDEAKPILDTLMDKETREKVKKEERGYLAVSVQDISAEARKLYEIPNGVYVYGVQEGSQAERAGLKRGDIISRLDGSSVTSTERLNEILESYRAGETVTVLVLTADGGRYRENELQITFEEQPQSSGYPGSRYGFGYDDYDWGWPFF